MLDNEFIMRTAAGLECQAVRQSLLLFMATDKKGSGVSSPYASDVAGVKVCTKGDLELAVGYLREKQRVLTIRRGLAAAGAAAGGATAAAGALTARATEGSGRDTKSSLDPPVYVVTSVEESGKPWMGNDKPGTVVNVVNKKGFYVKVRNSEWGVYCDPKPVGSDAVLVAVRLQVPLKVTGQTSIAQVLLANCHVFMDSFGGNATLALKEVLKVGKLPSSKVLLGGQSDVRPTLASFAHAVQELSAYMTATYSREERWTAGLIQIARDVQTRANRHGVTLQLLTSAWDSMVVKMLVDAAYDTSSVCRDYPSSEQQMVQLVAQEERLLRNLFDVWSVQMQVEDTVVRSVAERMSELQRGREAELAALRKEKADRPPPAAKASPFGGRGGAGRWGGDRDRDRDGGRGDRRRGRSESRSRSRSRGRGASPAKGGLGEKVVVQRAAGGAGAAAAAGRAEGAGRPAVQGAGKGGKVGCYYHFIKGSCRFSADMCRGSHDEKDRPPGARR
jgi:hypothetical protein